MGVTRGLFAMIVLAIFALITAHRVRDWGSDLTLWRSAVHTTPQSPRAHVNYASALITIDQLAEAEHEAYLARATAREAWVQPCERMIVRSPADRILAVVALRRAQHNRAAWWLEQATKDYPQGVNGQSVPMRCPS